MISPTLLRCAYDDFDFNRAIRLYWIEGECLLRVGLMTREYPPEVYGGAGVHVEYLSRELAKRIDVEVLCFGADRENARAFRPWEAAEPGGPALWTISVDVAMAADVGGADLVHSHTWYANLGRH